MTKPRITYAEFQAIQRLKAAKQERREMYPLNNPPTPRLPSWRFAPDKEKK